MALATLTTCVFTSVSCTKEAPVDSSHTDVSGEIENEGGMEVEDVTPTAGMSLKVVKMSYNSPLDPDTGIATAAEEGYQLTATVLPEDAADKTVKYSVAWSNADSTWASGKSVNDYVTVTQASEGALTATVTCNQAFGEPIIVTVTSNNNPNAKATATLHYKQKITGYKISSYNEFVTNGLVDYTEYGTGTDILSGTFTPDIEYDSREDGTLSILGSIDKSTVYTREDDTEIGYMEIVPTAEFKEVLTEMGVLESAMSSTGSSSTLHLNDFFDQRWFNYYGFGTMQTQDQINSHIAALSAFTGTAFHLNLYTAKGGTKLTSFELTLNTSKIVGQKQVESVTVDKVELEF